MVQAVLLKSELKIVPLKSSHVYDSGLTTHSIVQALQLPLPQPPPQRLLPPRAEQAGWAAQVEPQQQQLAPQVMPRLSFPIACCPLTA
jgi:hypothetical protein